MSMNFKAPRKQAAQPTAVRSIETVIQSAPDGRRNKAAMHGKKRALCITVNPAVLDQFDEYAAQLGQKRGPLIELVMRAAIRENLSLEELFGIIAKEEPIEHYE